MIIFILNNFLWNQHHHIAKKNKGLLAYSFILFFYTIWKKKPTSPKNKTVECEPVKAIIQCPDGHFASLFFFSYDQQDAGLLVCLAYGKYAYCFYRIFWSGTWLTLNQFLFAYFLVWLLTWKNNLHSPSDRMI